MWAVGDPKERCHGHCQVNPAGASLCRGRALIPYLLRDSVYEDLPHPLHCLLGLFHDVLDNIARRKHFANQT